MTIFMSEKYRKGDPTFSGSDSADTPTGEPVKMTAPKAEGVLFDTGVLATYIVTSLFNEVQRTTEITRRRTLPEEGLTLGDLDPL